MLLLNRMRQLPQKLGLWFHLSRKDSSGGTVSDKDTLDGRAARYLNPLRQSGRVRPISDKIMKSTVQVFQEFNHVRNNESLAHDNKLVDPAEARFIFDAVVNMLRFLKSIEGNSFGA